MVDNIEQQGAGSSVDRKLRGDGTRNLERAQPPVHVSRVAEALAKGDAGLKCPRAAASNPFTAEALRFLR